MAEIGNTPGPGVPKPMPLYKDWTVLQLGALVLLLDQFTKYLTIQLLPFRSSFPTEGFFRFTHTHNTGSAFGILQGMNTPLIFVSFVGIIVLVLIYRSQTQPNNWLRLSLGLQLGGAFGNLIDRFRLGYVTDFIDVGPWPVFNLADASIVTGLVLLAWIFLRPGQKEESRPVLEIAPGEDQRDAYPWCPVCDGEMMEISGGWRCTTCGVKERIDLSGLASAKREDGLFQPLGEEGPSMDGPQPDRDSEGRKASAPTLADGHADLEIPSADTQPRKSAATPADSDPGQ